MRRYGICLGLLTLLAGCGTGPGGETSPVTWKQIQIMEQQANLDTTQRGSVVLADFDQNGVLDAASGFVSSQAVVLHIQNSPESWTSTVLAEGLGSVYGLAAANLRDSGQIDMVAATAGGMRLLLAPSFSGPNPGPWSVSTLTGPLAIQSWNDVKIAQLDQQPELEIVGTSTSAKSIAVWRASGLITDASVYTGYEIASFSANGFDRLAVADIDGDGFTDIVALGPNQGIVWLQNPDAANITVPWPVHSITTDNGFTRLATADIDDDGDIDIAVTNRVDNRVWWFENPGSPRTDPWAQRLIADLSPKSPDAISVSDPDNDGIPDLFVGTVTVDPTIYWLRQFNAPRSPWQVFVVDEVGYSVGDLPVGDIGGTGGPDFAAALSNSPSPVVWYQRQ